MCPFGLPRHHRVSGVKVPVADELSAEPAAASTDAFIDTAASLVARVNVAWLLETLAAEGVAVDAAGNLLMEHDSILTTGGGAAVDLDRIWEIARAR